MAKLVKVCPGLQDYEFERRQLPLVVDDTLTMVMQFNDSCLGCEKGSIKQKEMESFVQKFSALTKDEVAIALLVKDSDIFHLLSQKVPCVGCRRSVERLFSQLARSSHPALEPLVITKDSELSINRNYLLDPKAMYALFHVHGSKFSTIVDSIPKSRKNKRCTLHSLETHKVKCLGTWTDVWDVLSKECREKVVLIDADSLLDTLETYLRKHRFCSDCKSKVQRAYSILVGEVNSNSEKGYCPALYEGLRCCPQDRHLHIHCDTDFIEQIIHRAEPELLGSSRRERHAKTLDIAQEEVLTCLGIHLYERLHRIWQKLRAEEQTWQILFCLGVESLKKNFEVALEKKQGKSNLELMCEELLAEEIAKEQKREQKRQKRKKKKNKGGPVENGWCPEQNSDTGGDKCECDENTNCSITNCANCDRDHSANNNTLDKIVDSCTDCKGDQDLRALGCKVPPPGSLSNRSDAGYSSGHEGCESCSMPSSNGSDIACSEESCNHDGNSSPCTVDLPDVCKEWLGDGREGGCRQKGRCKSTRDLGKAVQVEPQQNDSSPSKDSHYRTTLSLQDMLEASCSSEDEGDAISEEDIQRFKENSKLLSTKRQELRETLRKRFDMMCRNGQCAHPNCKMNHAMKDLNLGSE
ncbi:gametogenetin-binding protein 2-like isoform X2 [Lineus longissimus]|uniref:gametogenetin-binding protein 2-like isoform X2 n=1 Tax=Lineus longissimus TaxID=88925 RepID=UPI00315DB40D